MASKTPFGYGQFVIAGEPRNGAHRTSYRLCIGPIPPGMCVLHKCDNPSCVNPDHLFLGTSKDNVLDAMSKDRMPNGERSTSASLSQDDVLRIRSMFLSGKTQREIGIEFGVSQTAISKITRAVRWKHLRLAPLSGTGRRARGTKHGCSKLNEDAVYKIRSLGDSKTQMALAKQFGVSQVLIGKILRRDCWAWLK